MKKYSKISILLLSAALFSLPLRAFAQGFGVVSEAVAWIIRGVGYLINVIAGLFLTLAASLADFTLGFNIEHLSADALNSDGSLVRVGWELSRNIANLGFVLAIVIIAFATIIQYKSYGAKKFLPKLVAAAVIVNFSMAIAVPIVGFSNTITKFFLADQLGSSWGQNIKLSQTIADSFGPQKLILGETEEEGPLPPETTEGGGAFSGFGKALVLATASAVFSVVFTTITTIVFAALAFMLLIRYVWLTFLLILAPIAWLVWVIPGLERLFSKWWSNFFKWSLFAPAMSFFIYLALVGGKLLEGGEAVNTVRSNFSGNLQDIMAQGAEMIILAGLMLGGLIAANSLSIHGASGAIGIANKLGDWGKKGAAKAARRGALRAGSIAFRGKREEGKSLAERSRTYAQTRKTSFGRWATGLAAKGITQAESLGTETLAKEHEKVVSPWSDNRLLASLPGAIGPRKIAIMKELAKRNSLRKVENAFRLVTQGTKNLFARFGQSGSWGSIERAIGMNVKVNEEFQKYLRDKGKGTAGVIQAMNSFVGDLSKKDLSSMPLGEIFSGKDKLGYRAEDLKEFANILARSVAETNYILTPNVIPKLDSKQRDIFEQNYREAIENIRGTDPEKGEKVEKAFNSTMANYASGQEAPAPK